MLAPVLGVIAIHGNVLAPFAVCDLVDLDDRHGQRYRILAAAIHVVKQSIEKSGGPQQLRAIAGDAAMIDDKNHGVLGTPGTRLRLNYTTATVDGTSSLPGFPERGTQPTNAPPQDRAQHAGRESLAVAVS